ncbi:hypothetical protein ColTof4_08194 [Colletotrichum tofieldiae]|uniref:Uncharacterized protein n=1 Tax=Colletotrichum tofieldiae TaxID=708197 RepID=A0A166S2P7_9PEZI|nr:hypothetical protein CT0861_08681 [Colletotrichum tofieldiae]GKT54947.1 hypothetical protein ColTof3_02286 [Colletotrichum tofieldiae]GKT75771.1 hypothetical protein ColTof4_08194 [Colletotrichum tofieldiae]GKT83466.1 hypothetical protein Ct61P_01316 [Colletotrichum tofieldiae]
MTGHYLFETTDSVVEILWDIAIVFFIVRIALSYFFLTFTTSTLLSWAVCVYQQRQAPLSQQQHGLGTPQPDLVLIPLQAAVGAVFARYVVVAHDVPRVAWFRLAVGGLAAAFLAGAEAVLGFVLYAEGYGDWIREADGRCWIAVLGGLGIFAVMPAVLMAVEGEGRARAAAVEAHGRVDGKGGV